MGTRNFVVGRLPVMLACAVLGLATLDVKAAPIVYDNGAPNGSYESVDVSYLLADDFVFPVDTILTDILGWTGDSWMILRGDSSPDVLVAAGSFGNPIHVPLAGGTRYWVGVANGSIDDPCSVSSSGPLADRNDSRPAHYLSYHLGPLNGGGSPLCDGGAPPPPYDFSSPYWGLDHFSVEEDIAFQLVGVPVPEPSLVLMTGAGILEAFRRRRRQAHGRSGRLDTFPRG